jgi:hypothetical protein
MKKTALEKMTKRSLMELAREAKLPGRSKMTKEELIEALSKTPNRGKAKSPSIPKTKASARPSRKKNTTDPSVLRSEVGVRPILREEHRPEYYQQEVEQGRFDLGVREETRAGLAPEEETLPLGYGEDRIVLMVRDPYWLYSYWEIRESTVQENLLRHNLSDSSYEKVLRVYSGGETDYYDIDVEGLINNWYINVGRPNTDFFTEFGIRVEGQFFPLVQSNRVQTPRAAMSEVIDEKWMTLEEESQMMYALSGGFRLGRAGEGSVGLQEMMAKRWESEISSGAISSFFGSGRFREIPPRKFWYRLDAELIVYGATEPDAEVTLQGEQIHLRPDGTFTARFALPDGLQEIPVTFVSADRIDQGTITPKVHRRTENS